MFNELQDDNTWATTPVYAGVTPNIQKMEEHAKTGHDAWTGFTPWQEQHDEKLGDVKFRAERCSCGAVRGRIVPEGVTLPD